MSIFVTFIFFLMITADIKILVELSVCLHLAKPNTRVEGFAQVDF